MVNIILISHGVFCEGLLSSLKMIAGDEFGVRAVPLFPGETVDVYREKLGKALDETAGEDGTGSCRHHERYAVSECCIPVENIQNRSCVRYEYANAFVPCSGTYRGSYS